MKKPAGKWSPLLCRSSVKNVDNMNAVLVSNVQECHTWSTFSWNCNPTKNDSDFANRILWFGAIVCETGLVSENFAKQFYENLAPCIRARLPKPNVIPLAPICYWELAPLFNLFRNRGRLELHVTDHEMCKRVRSVPYRKFLQDLSLWWYRSYILWMLHSDIWTSKAT